jgi:hypothetical protein
MHKCLVRNDIRQSAALFQLTPCGWQKTRRNRKISRPLVAVRILSLSSDTALRTLAPCA